MQRLRNCSGKGEPAKILLNKNLYTRCPKATYLEESHLKQVIKIYFDCKDKKTWPHPGSRMDQTLWCIEVFDQIDQIIDDHIYRREQESQKKHDQEMKKLGSQTGSKRPAKRKHR